MNTMLELECLPAGSLVALQRIVEDLEAVSPIAVADLSLGSWTQQSQVTQWLGQLLGHEVAFKAATEPPQGAPALCDFISRAIDQDGKGNRAVVTVSKTAQQIVRTLGALSLSLRMSELQTGAPTLVALRNGWSLVAPAARPGGAGKGLVALADAGVQGHRAGRGTNAAGTRSRSSSKLCAS